MLASQASKWFKPSYKECREQFLSQVEALSELPSQHLEMPIAEDNTLVTDVCWLGNKDAPQVTVIISGTHGVEGYCGSAIQSYLLQQIQAQHLKPNAQQALLFIHALNPWGMHWARRCDKEGIDLNRNFVDFNHLPDAHAHYTEVLACLTLPDSTKRQEALNALAQQLGQRDFESAFSEGQYTQSWAPFYGGIEPASGHRTIDEVIATFQLEARRVKVIDLHTGLGPWGHAEIISDHVPGSQGYQFAQTYFGPAVSQALAGESFSVPKQGLLDYRWHELMNDYGCFVTLEFGTLGNTELFEVLLGEHLFWKSFQQTMDHSQNHTELNYWRQRMMNHFNPNDIYWQQHALFRSEQVLRCMLMEPRYA